MKYLAIVRFIAAIKEKQYCHASVLIATNGNYSCKVKSVNSWQGGPTGLLKHCDGKMKNTIKIYYSRVMRSEYQRPQSDCLNAYLEI